MTTRVCTQDATGDGALAVRDEAAALAAAGGDADLARELFTALMDRLQQDMADITGCVAAADWQGLVRSTHRLRGATSYCGVPALDAALGDLECAAKRRDSAEIARRFEAAAAEAQKLSES
jgi:HPt (histidine-containing phosphotransfer) domain-containing protein